MSAVVPLPAEEASENEVLGFLLGATPEAATAVAERLDPDHFSARGRRRIFEAIVALLGRGEAVDVSLVVGEMRRRATIEEVRNGPLGVERIFAEAGLPRNVGTHVERLLEAAERRRALQYANEAAIAATTGTDWRSPANELAALAEVPAERVATSWRPVDLAAAFDADPERPTILARTDGAALLYAGRRHAVFGEPESGKSWLVLAAAAERLAESERVVYVDFEDTPAAIVRRLGALGIDRERIEASFVYVAPTDPLAASARIDLEAALAPGCALAVVDGVTEAMVGSGLDPDKNADVARWMSDLPATLAVTGAVTVLVDHVAKDRTNRGRWAIGGQHKLATIDVAYLLDVLRPFAPGQTGTARISISKDKIGGVRSAALGGKVAGEFVLVSDDSGVLAEVRPIEFAPESFDDLAPAQRRVLDVLPSEPPGIGVREIGDRIAAAGRPLKVRTIQKALAALEAAGMTDAIHASPGLPATSWRTDEEAVEER
jgi:hypothetical protein